MDSTHSITADTSQIKPASRSRLVWSCFLGTTIEWYDFMLYGFLAPLVFDQLFFPKLSSVIGTIAVLGIFAVGFLARPLGGLVFGHFGDKFGRRPVMAATLITMGLSTALVGALPSYDSIGIWAPLLLTLLRFLQGFAIGGESTGAPVILLESAQRGKRGLFASLAQIGVLGGILSATVAASIVVKLPKDELLSWGWRVPFILSLVLVAIGYYMRSKVEESPAFLAAIERQHAARVPLLEVLARFKAPTAVVFCCAMSESGIFFLTAVFGLSYGTKTLGLSRSLLLEGLIIGNVVGMFMTPLFGALSDRFGRRVIVGWSFVLCALFLAFVFFPFLQTREPWLVLIAMATPCLVLVPMQLGTTASFYPELFSDARVRFSGVSLGRQFGAICGGGLLPIVSASLMSRSHGSVTGVLVYFGVISALSAVSVLLARETLHRDI